LAIKLSTPAIIVIAIVAIVIFYFFPILFYVAVLVGVIYVIGYFSRKKCPSCGVRGTIAAAGTEVVKTEKAFGLVTRMETSTTKKRDNRGRMVNENATSQRQERVPVVRTTLRTTYKCGRCGYSYATESVSEKEDFSRAEEPSKEKTVIVQKEVVKVPCKYCGTLNEVTQRTCSNCGAAIR